jgi:lysophospholipase L1-like esterase
MVDTFNAYPHLLHQGLKHRFPFAVINVIVTAIGGENSDAGAARFEEDVLCHRVDVVTIDYGLNDRSLGVERTRSNWKAMIEKALGHGAKVILLTPTMDVTQLATAKAEEKKPLREHAELIRELAGEYQVGLADSFKAFEEYVRNGDLWDLLSWQNHPNRAGHELVCRELLRWFPVGAAV